ncbi:MAG: hypothetical protein Kow00127_19750 [Bacteroidales bacterium]
MILKIRTFEYQTFDIQACFMPDSNVLDSTDAVANLNGYLMRLFTDMDSAMDISLMEMYGGLTNLILAIAGSIIVVAVCIYFLEKEFSKQRVQMAAQNN